MHRPVPCGRMGKQDAKQGTHCSWHDAKNVALEPKQKLGRPPKETPQKDNTASKIKHSKYAPPPEEPHCKPAGKAGTDSKTDKRL